MHSIGLAYTKIQISTKCPFRATVKSEMVGEIIGWFDMELPKG